MVLATIVSLPFSKLLDEINETDLQELVSGKEAERKTLDYKRDRVGDKPSEHKEFLYDVSSFANTSGGYLFIGIDENEGVPTDLCGLPTTIDPDSEISRLVSILLLEKKVSLRGKLS